MTEDNQPVEAALEGLDEGKRSTLKRLIGAGAFVRPIVVSFAMADLSIDAFMHSAVANLTTTARPTTRPASTTTTLPGSTTTTLPGATTTTLPGATTTTLPGSTTTTAPPKPHPTKS
jgi:hypothetical protein